MLTFLRFLGSLGYLIFQVSAEEIRKLQRFFKTLQDSWKFDKMGTRLSENETHFIEKILGDF